MRGREASTVWACSSYEGTAEMWKAEGRWPGAARAWISHSHLAQWGWGRGCLGNFWGGIQLPPPFRMLSASAPTPTPVSLGFQLQHLVQSFMGRSEALLQSPTLAN